MCPDQIDGLDRLEFSESTSVTFLNNDLIRAVNSNIPQMRT